MPLLDSITHFALDHREIQVGGAFFALKGEKFDGHDFLKEVSEKGGRVAFVDFSYRGPSYGLKLIFCSVPEELKRRAKERLQKENPYIVAITGSHGKTTVKDFIFTFLQASKNVYKTQGNQNTKLTLPLTILNAPWVDYLVLEMGMTHPYEIAKLVEIAPPDIGVLTFLAEAHIGFFDSFEELAYHKGQIFAHPKTSIGILNEEIPFLSQVRSLGSCPKKLFSLRNSDADYYLEEKDQLHFYKEGKKWFETPFHLLGPHNRLNVLAAVSAVDQMGLEKESIKAMIPQLQLPKMRLELIEKEGLVFLNDAYNIGSVEGVLAALKSIPKRSFKRKIGVLSALVDQKEVDRKAYDKICESALLQLDALYVIGQEGYYLSELWKKSGKKGAFFLSYNELLDYLKGEVSLGDFLLLKGGRRFSLERLIHDLLVH